MPQLWLTYQEIADELGCEPSTARETAVARAWTRKRSHDGHTRVLMPFDLMHAYFATKAIDPPAGAQASPPPLEQLRRIVARASPRQSM